MKKIDLNEVATKVAMLGADLESLVRVVNARAGKEVTESEFQKRTAISSEIAQLYARAVADYPEKFEKALVSMAHLPAESFKKHGEPYDSVIKSMRVLMAMTS